MARAEGYHVTSSTTDTVYWCLGKASSGRRILHVTNHRSYPLQVFHPNMAVLTNLHDYLALSALSRYASGPFAILAPGANATFNADLEPGSREGIQTELDAFGQSLYALQVGVETLLSVLTRFGAGSDKKAVEAVGSLLSVRSCADSLGKGGGAFLAGCFSPDQMITALGRKALLVVPLMVFGPLLSFFRSELNALVDQFNNHDRYEILLTRDKPAISLCLHRPLVRTHKPL